MLKEKNFSDSKLSNRKKSLKKTSLGSSSQSSTIIKKEGEEEAKASSASSGRESFKLSTSSQEKQAGFISRINPKFFYKASSRNHVMPQIVEEFTANQATTETTAQSSRKKRNNKRNLRLKLNKGSIQSKPFYMDTKVFKKTQKASSLSPNRPDQMNFLDLDFKDLVVEKAEITPDMSIVNRLRDCWEITDCFDDNQILEFMENYKDFPNMKNLEQKRKEHLEEYLKQLQGFLVKEKICPNLPKELPLSEMKKLEKSDYPNRDINFLITTSKCSKSSPMLQRYMEITPDENISKLVSILEPHAYDLSFNKFSNYIVQHMIQRSEIFKGKFLEVAMKKFEIMITNEYASRVLQKFIILGENRIEELAIQFLTFNPDYFLSNVSAVILLNKVIVTTKNTENLEKIKIFFKNAIIMNPLLLQSHRHMIRILMNLFTVMNPSEISVIFFYIKDFIHYLSNHKFGMYLLQKVIEKEVKPFDLMIKNFLVKNYSMLFEIKTAKYVIFRALEFEFRKKQSGFFALGVLKGIVVDRDRLSRITYGRENMTMFLAALFGIQGKEFSHTLVLVVNTLLKVVSEDSKKMQCKELS